MSVRASTSCLVGMLALMCCASALDVSPAAAAATSLVSWGGTGAGPGQFDTPMSIAVHGPFVFVADFGNHRVERFTRDGQFVSAWGGRGDQPGQVDAPLGLVVDARGAVYVSDF